MNCVYSLTVEDIILNHIDLLLVALWLHVQRTTLARRTRATTVEPATSWRVQHSRAHVYLDGPDLTVLQVSYNILQHLTSICTHKKPMQLAESAFRVVSCRVVPITFRTRTSHVESLRIPRWGQFMRGNRFAYVVYLKMSGDPKNELDVGRRMWLRYRLCVAKCLLPSCVSGGYRDRKYCTGWLMSYIF